MSAELEATSKKEKEKVSVTSASLDLKPPYPAVTAIKPYPSKFDGCKGYTRENGPFAHNSDLCLREFSKSLPESAYTWYINLKPRLDHD